MVLILVLFYLLPYPTRQRSGRASSGGETAHDARCCPVSGQIDGGPVAAGVAVAGLVGGVTPTVPTD